MVMAACSTTLSIAGGAQTNKYGFNCKKLKSLDSYPSQLVFPHYSKQMKHRPNLSLCAQHGNDAKGGNVDFVAGFILGGAVFGTLAYIFAPQIRRSLLNEDESGFQRAKQPIYYDESLEKTRQTLNEKISQLNSAIDNVSSRLRGGNNVMTGTIEADPEVEATIDVFILIC